MKLDGLEMIQILPAFMRKDKTVRGLCKAADVILNRLTNECMKLDIYNNLKLLKEEDLDYIAKINNIFWYDGSDSYQAKVDVIHNANIVFSRLGTSSAVTDVVSDILQDESKMREWFDYSGIPYHFIIELFERVTNTKELQTLNERILKVKNVRSQLDGYINNFSASGMVVQCVGFTTIPTVEIRMGELNEI